MTLKGPVSPVTGMVVNITDLKSYMDEVIMKKLDHKNIDEDVDFFKNGGIVSTTENLAIYIFNELRSLLPNPNLLHKVKIHETDKNSVVYRGEIT